MDVDRVEKNGKCPQGTQACSMNANAENTVCYPQSEHATSCPITYINILGQNDAAAAQKRGEVEAPIKLSNDLALVYSKKTNSLPITTIRVENRPCVSAQIVSNNLGTILLKNEVKV